MRLALALGLATALVSTTAFAQAGMSSGSGNMTSGSAMSGSSSSMAAKPAKKTSHAMKSHKKTPAHSAAMTCTSGSGAMAPNTH